MSLSFLNKGTSQFTTSGGEEHKMENNNDVSIQEQYIETRPKDYDLNEDLMCQVLDLNIKYIQRSRKVKKSKKRQMNIKEMEFQIYSIMDKTIG